MGYYCWLCGGMRPNEAFSGKGRRLHECRRCRRSIPPARREKLRLLRELKRYLEQSRISDRNVGRATTLAAHDDEEVRTLAAIVADIGRAHPHRRRRYRAIIRSPPALWTRMIAAGLVGPLPPNIEDPPSSGEGPVSESIDPSCGFLFGSDDPEDDLDLPF